MEGPGTKLLFPGLGPFYARAEPVSWPLARATAGLMIVPHGIPRTMAGIGPAAAFALVKRGTHGGRPYSLDRWLGRER